MDDVTFGRTGRDSETWRLHHAATVMSGVAIAGRSLMSMNACLYCSIDNDIPSLDSRYRAVVNYHGKVTWVPAAKFRSGCQIDMRRFPFDEQR